MGCNARPSPVAKQNLSRGSSSSSRKNQERSARPGTTTRKRAAVRKKSQAIRSYLPVVGVFWYQERGACSLSWKRLAIPLGILAPKG
ncbi:MAG: hypothetical protein BWY86_01289 [Candidatus Aminicenantes bacterium ADurb.Bin508]|nr:MAG: hypothetical protein BWY86_01289 [Candidatus Aminicenantes bacterium ADurb.Bin508]